METCITGVFYNIVVKKLTINNIIIAMCRKCKRQNIDVCVHFRF